jgi:hypothetical protein
MINRLHRLWKAPPWAWGVVGAINGTAVALTAFALAELAAAVNDPLFNAVVIMGPLLLGTAMLMGGKGGRLSSCKRASSCSSSRFSGRDMTSPDADWLSLMELLLLALFFLHNVGIHVDWWPLVIGAMQGLGFLMLTVAFAHR